MKRKAGTGIERTDGAGLAPGAVSIFSTDDALAYAAVVALVAGLVVAWVH